MHMVEDLERINGFQNYMLHPAADLGIESMPVAGLGGSYWNVVFLGVWWMQMSQICDSKALPNLQSDSRFDAGLAQSRWEQLGGKALCIFYFFFPVV